MSVLSIENVSFSYRKNRYVLKDISFSFEKGKTYAIMGKSGSGKTTLLSLISGLETVRDGKILYNGKDISAIDKEFYRSRDIGVVFQNFNLLPHLTAIENVILSMDVSGVKLSAKEKMKKAMDLLEKVGLDEDKANRRILKLSGGEQQRVAIARAVSYDPDIVIADEPTGNLDYSTETEIMDLLTGLAKEDNKCVIIVTHAPSVAERADTVYTIASQEKITAKPKKSAVSV
ncbi:MAG: ABC transporter ATP-binding protein [Saccharofermentanales bacterium]